MDRPLPAAAGRAAGAAARRVRIRSWRAGFILRGASAPLDGEAEATRGLKSAPPLVQNLERDHYEDGRVFFHSGNFSEHGLLPFHEITGCGYTEIHVLKLV